METYCGKNCYECSQGGTLSCPGCKNGPGRSFCGECEIASCCRDRVLDGCAECPYAKECEKGNSAKRQPEERLAGGVDTEEKRALISERARVFGKRVMLLFRFLVVENVAAFLPLLTVLWSAVFGDITALVTAGLYPYIDSAYELLGIAGTIAYGAVLINMAGEERGYRRAGLCIIAWGVANIFVVAAGVFASEIVYIIVRLLMLPTTLGFLAGQYREFKAHVGILTGIDNKLSAKWRHLWSWYLGLQIFTAIAKAFTNAIEPETIILYLLTLVGMIGLYVTGIVKTVCLFRTAKAFGVYAETGGKR